MTSHIKVELASPPDRDKLVAPLMLDNEQWAEELREIADTILAKFQPGDGNL